MKYVFTQLCPRILGVSLLLLVFNFKNKAQCVLNGGSSAPDVTLQCSGGTSNRTGLAYNPVQNLYYSVNAGSIAYPIETFTVSGGSALSSTTQGADYRGYWWNSLTGEPEGNTVASGGLYSNSLNGSFYGISITSSLGAANMPNGQSCGAGDLANSQVIYYNSGYIYKYSRSTGLISSSVSISGLPVSTSNLNSTSVIYTGISGKEAGVYDYVNKCVYLINYNTGAYVSTYTLPASAPANSSYKFSFCNNRVFLYNSSTSQWFGYYTVITGTGTQTNVTCNGFDNAVAQITPTTGASPYSYTWSPSGGNSNTASDIAPGTYTVYMSDANGCTGTETFVITEPPVLSTSTLALSPLCNGGNGAATITASGGTAPYTYSWSTGATSSAISSQLAGTYTAKVTDANNCISTKTVVITQPSALVTTTAVSNVLCFGNNGSATITASGGTTPYTYSWSSGGTASVNTFPAGTYTATVTDANNCSSSKQVVITEPTALSTISTYVNALCNGANGSATLNSSGGTGAYTYSWSSGNTSSLVSLPAGTYTAIVTDANNCINSMTIPINQPSALVTATAISIPLCYGGIGSATATASGGTAPYIYNWNGGTSSWSTSAAISVASLSAGIYTVTTTDANACINSVEVILNQPADLLPSVSSFSAQCNGGYGSAGVSATGGTGAYTYSWSSGSNSVNVSLLAGNYTVTVTDVNNCSSSATTSIAEPAALVVFTTVANALCNGSNGTASLNVIGGTGPYTYSWSIGATTSTVSLPAGVHSATVTDFHSCTRTVTVNITQPSALVVNSGVTNAPCFASYGSATVTASGGTAPYTYTWSTGLTVSSSTMFPGTYTAVVKDANNCTSINTVVVTQPSAISPNVMLANAKCYGGLGGATLTPSGGTGTYSVVWFSGQQGTVVSLSVGAVSYTVYDGNGCMSPGSVLITQPPPISATIQTTHSYCTIANSTVALLVTGGTLPYTFYWSTGSGSGSLQALPAGTYSVGMLDANGCSTGGNFNVSPPAILSASVIGNTPILCYGGTSNVTVALSGGFGPYTYTYNGTASTSSVGSVPAGTNIILVKDGNNCIQTLSVNITQPPVFSAYLAVISPILCKGGTASVQVTTSGGVAPYTYTWSNTANTGSLANVQAGSYVTVVKDANGCSYIFQFSVGEPPLLTASVSASPILCYGGASTINVTAGGGTPTYIGTNTFTVHAGSGTVTVVDFNNCSATAQYSVSQPALIASTSSHTICAGESFVFGQQTLTASGTYTNMLNAVNTCDSLVTLNLHVNSPVNVGVVQNGSVLTASLSGAIYQWINCETNAPMGGETSQTFNVTQDGSYAVIVTKNGCSDTSACVIYSTVGIKAYNKVNVNMRIQPNPGTGQFILTTNETADLITISDITGKEILSLKPDSTRTYLDLIQQENGIYFVTLIKGNGRSTAKLVINR